MPINMNDVLNGLICLPMNQPARDEPNAVMDCYLLVKNFPALLDNVTEGVQGLHRSMSVEQRQSARGVRAHLWGSEDTANSNVDGDEWKRHLPRNVDDSSFAKALPELKRAYLENKRFNPAATEMISRDVIASWLAMQRGKMKTRAKAIGIIAAITTLVVVAPKLLGMIQGGASGADVRQAFADLAGEAAWLAIFSVGASNVRNYLIQGLGPATIGTGTLVGTVAVECLLACFLFMRGNTAAKHVLDTVSTELAVACCAVIFHPEALSTIVHNFTVVSFGAVYAWTQEFLGKIPEFVHRATQFLEARAKFPLTAKTHVPFIVLGVGMILVSPSNRAVMLRAQAASTLTGMFSLNDAKAAALVWLGEATGRDKNADGEENMAAAQAILDTATTVGFAAAGLAAILLVGVVLKIMGDPKSVGEVGQRVFGENAGLDALPTQEEFNAFYATLREV